MNRLYARFTLRAPLGAPCPGSLLPMTPRPTTTRPVVTSAIAQCVLTTLLLVVTARSAYAYVGPGVAVGVVATVFGVIGGLLMLLFGAIWYPLKKLLQTIRSAIRK